MGFRGSNLPAPSGQLNVDCSVSPDDIQEVVPFTSPLKFDSKLRRGLVGAGRAGPLNVVRECGELSEEMLELDPAPAA